MWRWRPCRWTSSTPATPREFKRDIAPLLEANAKLVLDLSRLRFVDSSGLGAFISCLRKLNAKGGDLKLYGMSKQVRAVFELVRMHRVFDIVGTREDAVRAFQTSDARVVSGPDRPMTPRTFFSTRLFLLVVIALWKPARRLHGARLPAAAHVARCSLASRRACDLPPDRR